VRKAVAEPYKRIAAEGESTDNPFVLFVTEAVNEQLQLTPNYD
jgi:hypothetical protein